jgi:hypothetical protein
VPREEQQPFAIDKKVLHVTIYVTILYSPGESPPRVSFIGNVVRRWTLLALFDDFSMLRFRRPRRGREMERGIISSFSAMRRKASRAREFPPKRDTLRRHDVADIVTSASRVTIFAEQREFIDTNATCSGTPLGAESTDDDQVYT